MKIKLLNLVQKLKFFTMMKEEGYQKKNLDFRGLNNTVLQGDKVISLELKTTT